MAKFSVSKTTKEHAGEYQCVVDNNVGKPSSAKFYIRILCKLLIEIPFPRVGTYIVRTGVFHRNSCFRNVTYKFSDPPRLTAKNSWVQSAIGQQTELSCKVDGNPTAKVRIEVIQYVLIFISTVKINFYILYVLLF